MSSKKAPTKKQMASTVGDVSKRLEELEKQADLLNDTIQILTRRQDAATECFDQRTRQLLAWANEITKAAGKEVDGIQTAEDLMNPEDGVASLAEAAREGGPALPTDEEPALARTDSVTVGE
jgi:hypothetical protein